MVVSLVFLLQTDGVAAVLLHCQRPWRSIRSLRDEVRSCTAACTGTSLHPRQSFAIRNQLFLLSYLLHKYAWPPIEYIIWYTWSTVRYHRIVDEGIMTRLTPSLLNSNHGSIDNTRSQAYSVRLQSHPRSTSSSTPLSRPLPSQHLLVIPLSHSRNHGSPRRPVRRSHNHPR